MKPKRVFANVLRVVAVVILLIATVPLVLMIHKASNGQMSAALARIGALACVKKEPRMIRVEHFN